MRATKQIRRILTVILWGIGLLSCVAVVWLFGLGKSMFDSDAAETAIIYQSAPTPGSDLDLIEADAQIKVPASAREIHAMITGFREIDTWVRLDIPASDLGEFIKKSQCTTPLAATEPTKHSPAENDPEWWQPHRAKRLEECTGGHDYLFQHILVDRTDPELVRVYVLSLVDTFVTPTAIHE